MSAHSRRQTLARQIKWANWKEQARQQRPAESALRHSSYLGQSSCTWTCESNKRVRSCAHVAGKFQQAQPGCLSIGWPLPRVGRRLATWSQLTMMGGFCADVDHLQARMAGNGRPVLFARPGPPSAPTRQNPSPSPQNRTTRNFYPILSRIPCACWSSRTPDSYTCKCIFPQNPYPSAFHLSRLAQSSTRRSSLFGVTLSGQPCVP